MIEMAAKQETRLPYEKTITLKSGAGIYELNEIDGIFYSTMTTAAHYKQLEHFETRDDDIWLATYLKTGTHWTWEIINMMKQQSAEISEESFNFLEVPVPSDNLELVGQKLSPRTIVSHLPADKVPKHLFSSKAKIIYIFRNPKDAFISLYHNMKNSGMISPLGPFAGDLGDWLHILTSNPNIQMYGGLVNHAYAWLEKAKEFPEKILPLMYEDMKKDPATAVQRIADFLGFPLSPELKAAIVEKTEFKKMTEVKLGGGVKGFLAGDTQRMFYRKGQVGAWKSEFTVAQNEAMDAVLTANPRYNSLPFVYTL